MNDSTLTMPELEICAGDRDSVEAALLGGATRVEICTALGAGGLTPQQSLMELTSHVSPALRRHVLIRPRPGDFLYSNSEMQTMITDVGCRGIADADGFVIGILRPDGSVDRERTSLLMKAASGDGRRRPSFTFHRAFDMTSDPFQALEDTIGLGFDRVLTSGCAATAEAGIKMLRKLNEQAAGRIIIMACGGVNASNARMIMEETGITSLHASCSHRMDSRMEYRNLKTSMGTGCDDEYSHTTTSREKVEALREAMKLTKTF